jgi:two-component system response regulator DevR
VTSATADRVSVLVVDDSAIVRQRLCALLAEDDSICVAAEAGGVAEAWERFEQCRPDAVVLDIHLPDGSGIDVLRRVKQAKPSCQVIMLTNLCEAPFRCESERCGADHFLHKATEFERVAELLHRRVGISPSSALPEQTRPPPGPASQSCKRI